MFKKDETGGAGSVVEEYPNVYRVLEGILKKVGT